MKLLAFDLEIAALIPDDSADWKQFRPLGITCAAVAWAKDNGSVKTLCFHGEDDDFRPVPRMRQGECVDLVWTLQAHALDGYTLLTHNGVSFDFDVLAEESGMHAECVELAMNSADLCFQTLCVKGYPIGLDALCRGMGLESKIEGMSGALAPQLWSEGQYAKVLEYVAQDTKSTLSVALEVERRGSLSWIAKSGRLNTMPVGRILTVRECLQLEKPDTSWMTGERPNREMATAWMTKTSPVV